MSERTTRLCDVVESTGALCTRTFEEVCSLCELDVCSFHKGANFLGSRITVAATNPNDGILGFTHVAVCRQCADALHDLTGPRTRLEFGELAKSIQAQLVETARAILAEQKLKGG